MNKILFHFILMGIILSLSLINPFPSRAQGPIKARCDNFLLNGDFEGNNGWNLTSSPLQAQYSPLSYRGEQSLQLGLAPDQVISDRAWSAARQTVTLPAERPITLSLWYRTEIDPEPGNDQVFMALLNEEDQVIETFLDSVPTDDEWQLFSQPISTEVQGPVQLYFGVENDGAGGATRLLIDDVQLCTAAINLSQPFETSSVESASKPTILSGNEADVVSFERLGAEPLMLESPFGGATLRFSLPATWQPTTDAELYLDLNTLTAETASPLPSEAASRFRGALEVRLNDELLTAIPIGVRGEQTIPIRVPLSALTSNRNHGQQVLDLNLKADVNCGTADQTSVLLRPSSRFIIPHQIIEPTTDLRQLPWPIYQDSFLPDAAMIVVPNQPTFQQIQAALSVAAGFGRMTRGRLDMSLLPVEQLTTEIQTTNHLIFVGQAAEFPILEAVALPAPNDGIQFAADGADTADGIIQMAVSPWSQAHVVLVIGGASDMATIKAAQAVSSGMIRVGARTDLTLVADIHPNNFSVSPMVIDRTFTELGYPVRQLKSQGTNYAEYYFNVPAGYIGDPEAYLDLVINHSSLLDYEASGIVVRLNGVSIGSIRFTDDFTSPGRIRLSVPRSALVPGKNELQIRAELEPATDCVNPNTGGLWLTIWPESLLHLPLNPAPGEAKSNLQLHSYPQPFIQSPSLANTAFILPSNNPTAWNIAAQIAFDLGHHSDLILAELMAFYDTDIPEAISQTRNLLIIGHPNELAIVENLNDVMPVAFEAGRNLASEQQMPVSYRLPDDTSLGYLQLFPSPWNRNQAVLTVLGSTNKGLQWAANALLDSDLRDDLENNLAIISEEQITNGRSPALVGLPIQTETVVQISDDKDDTVDTIEAVDSHDVKETTSANEVSSVNVPEETDQASAVPAINVMGLTMAGFVPPIEGQPVWLIPVLAGSIALTLLTLIIAALLGWRQRRSSSR